MNRILVLILLVVAALLCIVLFVIPPQTVDYGREIDLKDLPVGVNSFKCVDYLRPAIALQKLRPRRAYHNLLSLAKAEMSHQGGPDFKAGEQVTILCRMLFTKKANGSFRAPMLGEPHFLGGSHTEDWPLEPIEIVDGVPFLVVEFYTLLGWAESSFGYLQYCAEHCKWSSTSFEMPSEQTLQKALDKLLASSKWKRPLTDGERKFLSAQIK